MCVWKFTTKSGIDHTLIAEYVHIIYFGRDQRGFGEIIAAYFRYTFGIWVYFLWNNCSKIKFRLKMDISHFISMIIFNSDLYEFIIETTY